MAWVLHTGAMRDKAPYQLRRACLVCFEVCLAGLAASRRATGMHVTIRPRHTAVSMMYPAMPEEPDLRSHVSVARRVRRRKHHLALVQPAQTSRHLRLVQTRVTPVEVLERAEVPVYSGAANAHEVETPHVAEQSDIARDLDVRRMQVMQRDREGWVWVQGWMGLGMTNPTYINPTRNTVHPFVQYLAVDQFEHLKFRAVGQVRQIAPNLNV